MRIRIQFLIIAAVICVLLPVSVTAQQRQMGLVFADDAAYRSIPLAATPLLGEIPPSVDLSNRFPSPGDQGAQGSCVGWAVAYALKSYQEHVERRWDLADSRHRFSPAYIYNQIKLSDCRGGSSFLDALNLLRREGVESLNDFPYQDTSCDIQPTDAQRQAARKYAVADWRRVNVQDETEVKTQLASGFPVLIGMVVDSKFLQLGPSTYDGYSGENLGGHAIAVIGYDDARRAFRIINSWGVRWGDRGYGWLSYSSFRQVSREGYVVQDIVAVPPLEPAPTPPAPTPTPPLRPRVELGLPSVLHNVTVPAPAGIGTAPGMSIAVPGTVTNASGKTLQIVVKFNYRNGPPLFANPQEMNFRDVSGLVATGIPPRTVGSNQETLSNIPVSIPYYALNFMPTGGQRNYDLSLTVFVNIDNETAAESPPVPFGLRW